MAAGASFFVNYSWIGFAVSDSQSWTNRLLDRVIQATSIGVAFWGIAVTLLIGMEAKPVVLTLKSLKYFGLLVRYFCESLYATFSLLLVSVVIEPLSLHFSPLALSSVWVAVGVWALFTTTRTFLTLTRILARMD